MLLTGVAGMAYRQLTVDNRSLLKRFSHRRRFVKTIELLAPSEGQRLLDYGTGDGYLLTLLADYSAPCELVGYEPMPSQLSELQKNVRGTPIQWISDTSRVPDGSFDRIACCEVLEHLGEQNQRRVLADIHRLLKPAGRVVITVPIEVGVASLAKNLARIAIRQAHDETSLKNIVKALFGIRGQRKEQEGYIYGHVGFRYKDLLPLFSAANLTILKRSCSPLGWAGPLLNSQVLYLLRPAASRGTCRQEDA